MGLASKANHHFIPQFYLRSFASGVGRQSRLFTVDTSTKKSFTTHVRNVCSRRYYNRFEADGVHPDIIEDTYGEIETELSEHFKDIIQAKEFVSREHYISIMNLIAIISVRNPRFRKIFSEFHSDVAKKTMSIALSSEKTWQSQMDSMRDDGVPIDHEVSYQELKDFHDRGEYDVVTDQNYLIKLELESIDTVLNCLIDRNWCFVSAPEGSDFITCDDPVVLAWQDEERTGKYPPGHGLQGTVLIFPMSPSLLLVGTFEEIPTTHSYTPSQVTNANTMIARNSSNQIYARDGSFRLDLKFQNNVVGNEVVKVLNRK